MSDLLVNLYRLDTNDTMQEAKKRGVLIKRVLPPDKTKVIEFVRKYYGENWVGECETAIYRSPVSCFIAVKDKEILGFACYDATAKGYFGPIGMSPDQKGKGMGKALMYAALDAMREDGYGYAVIGWADSNAMGFYENSLSLFVIPDSESPKTVYSRMASIMPE